jgi:hypothetical protein
VVGGQELRQRDPPVISETRDLRQEIADQQAGGALGPHVYVVADLHPLGGESEEVDRARRLNDLPQHRRRDVAQEVQPSDRRRRFTTEPSGLPWALVDRRECPGATVGVVDDEDRRRRADGTRHGQTVSCR